MSATLRTCPHGVTLVANLEDAAAECLQCERIRVLEELAKEVQRLEDEAGAPLTKRISECLDALHSVDRRMRARIVPAPRDTLPDGLLEEQKAYR